MCWFADNRFRLSRLRVCNWGSESEDVDLECRRRSESNPPIPESSPEGMDYSQEIPGKVNRLFGNYRYVSATTITGQVPIMTGLWLDRKSSLRTWTGPPDRLPRVVHANNGRPARARFVLTGMSNSVWRTALVSRQLN